MFVRVIQVFVCVAFHFDAFILMLIYHKVTETGICDIGKFW